MIQEINSVLWQSLMFVVTVAALVFSSPPADNDLDFGVHDLRGTFSIMVEEPMCDFVVQRYTDGTEERCV